MATFLSEDFLLGGEVARELYHEHAKTQPIYDYHCHLPPAQIAANHRFADLAEAWLAGDHYKWRAMRSNGVEERYCTGDAPPYDKFLAFARTLPYALRNPLYHWSHLELKRYFGIERLLDEESAPEIWDAANRRLEDLPVHVLLEMNRVAVVCTTDDPTDALEHHDAIRAGPLKTRVYPAFRPDRALGVGEPAAFNGWVARLEAVSGVACGSLAEFVSAIEKRVDFFHSKGCRLSDHGLAHAFGEPCGQAEAARVFTAAREGRAASPPEAARFGAFLMVELGRMYAARDWAMQLHLGAMRNNNSRMKAALGVDAGYDSIGDWPQAAALAGFLDALDRDGRLPRTILYNLNPADNYLFATMIGNFQEGPVPGKLQFGSGWWFLDQKEGMEWQLNALSNLGLLRRSVGMLTDSRSFLSYPRHEYFRRILCDLLGRDVERGELPRDMALLGAMVREICYQNAAAYFGMEPGPTDPSR